MKNSRKKIRVQPIYTMLIWFILVLVFTAFLVFPSFIWENKQDVWKIVYYLMFSICLAACLFAFLYYIQFAILDKEGITIRGLFHTIAKVKWIEIYSIEERSVVTYDNRGYISLRWLVIHLQKKEPEIKRGGINKRKPPWQIVATKKNKELIQKYHTIIKPNYDYFQDNKKQKNKNSINSKTTALKNKEYGSLKYDCRYFLKQAFWVLFFLFNCVIIKHIKS